MLSYRHGYHAGNSADVLKHFVLERLLNHLTQKDKGCFYLDTHAGAGFYSLQSPLAEKTGEYRQGIARVLAAAQTSAPPACLMGYLNRLAPFVDTQGQIGAYPGSPWWAAEMLRPHDRIALCELHPQDALLLTRQMAGDKRVKVYDEDGFKKSLALVPPPERRGLVMMDPSYEIKSDYERIAQQLAGLHRRFATGVYAIWYPVVDVKRSDLLKHRVRQQRLKDTLFLELRSRQAGGMYASGMIIVNSPWTLADDAKTALPWLAQALAEDDSAGFEISAEPS